MSMKKQRRKTKLIRKAANPPGVTGGSEAFQRNSEAAPEVQYDSSDAAATLASLVPALAAAGIIRYEDVTP